MKNKIYILDDHPVVVEGLTKILDGQTDLEIVGSATDATKAVHQIQKMKPEVVILDISLKDRSGVDLIKRIKTASSNSRILVYSMHEENVYAERCLRAGAMGYLMKGESAERLIYGVRQILAGTFYFSPNLLANIVSGGGPRTGSRGEPGRMLSDRQLEVFEMVGRGFDSHEIGEKLGLSSKTVDAHKANIRQKLGLASARELLMEAVRWVEK